MKTNLARKVVSFLSSLSILLNSFAPFVLITPQTAFSHEPLKNTITYNNSKGVFHFEVNNKDAAVTSGPISYSLLYRNELTGQIQNVNGSTDLSDFNFARDIDAATCSSGGTCVPHVVNQGIIKVKVESANWFDSQWFKIENGSLVVKAQFNSGDVMGLSSDEQNWLSTGEGPAPTPTPTVEPTATPTVEPTATPTEVPTPTATIIPTAIPQLGNEEVQVKVVKLDGSYADPNLVPSTWTDKADYAPTEKVVVSGKNFVPNYEYTIVISSNDDPAVTHTGTFAALSDGTFTYEYQLDGHYRPNYVVQIKDATGTVVASTTFTDSVSTTTTVSGVSCMAEQPNQTHLTCTAQDTPLTHVSAITINTSSDGHKGCRYPGDKVDFTATWELQANANERYNLGLWFATEGQASALNGICSVTSLPSSPPPFFDGGTKCGGIDKNGTGTIQVTMSAVCNPDANGLLRLPYCSSWQQKDNNGNGNNNNITACNSPIDTVPGSPSKCKCEDGFTIDIPVPPSTIEVVKKTSPLDDGGKFNLKINGTTYASNVGNGGTTGRQTVSAGSNSIAEAAGSDTDLTNYSSSVLCKDKHGDGTEVTTSGTNPWPLTASVGQDILCTITNTRKNNASITVIKHAAPHDSQDFEFTTTGGLTTPFYLDDDTDATLPNTTTFGSLAAGPYSITESPTTGWNLTNLVCTDNATGVSVGSIVDSTASLALRAGQNVTCTFTNTRQPKLTLVKTVTKDNGGTAVPTDWTLSATSTSKTASGKTGDSTITNAYVPAGIYTLSESGGPSGYTPGNWSCVGATVVGSSLSLSNGDIAICTINNDDKPATLTVTKSFNKLYNGTLGCSDFSFKVNDGPSIPFEADCSNDITVNAGTYSVVENPVDGYTPAYTNCTDVVISNGGKATCSIVNNDLPATLIVKKIVVNDNGGTKVAQDFTFKVNGTGSDIQFIGTGATGEVTLTQNQGTYSVVENPDSQYTTTYDNCSRVRIDNGKTATCTITNDDKPATLTLTKIVDNFDGGMKGASDFPVQIDNVISTWGAHTVNAGPHTVSETSQFGYTPSAWGGSCSATGEITLLPGESKSCTITNDDVAPQLKLVKSVVNDNGGGVHADGWNLTATGTVLGFTDKGDSIDFHTVKAGVVYTLSESTVAGYASSGWSCDGGNLVDGKVTLLPGQNVICTVTNDDVAPKLTLIKKVTTDNGGTAKPDDFNLTVGGTSVKSGEKNTFAANTPYAINETQQDGYGFVSITGDEGCPKSLGGTITLKPGDNKTCTITNDDIAPSLTLKKEVKNDNGGRAVSTDWKLIATGPSTLSGQGIATSGATFAAGTYTLTESGPNGYTAGPWSCTGVDVVVSENISKITLSPGQSTVCTITNDDIAPKVTLIKQILGREGLGELNFGLTVGGSAVTSGIPIEVRANTPISLNENGLPGYQFVAIHGTGEGDQCPEVLGGTVTLSEGQNVSCTITNQYVPAELTIAKYNTTWPNTTTPGGEVQYTLKLKVSKNNINNLLVVDLPANGFKYKPGSYHVTIGGVDATASIAEPQYHSPGQWKLGDINLGENDEVEILLSYTATVDPNQKPGLYKDLAWAYGSQAGINADSTRLLASSTDAGTSDPGVITDQFVGSKVAVNKETQNSTSVNVVTKQTSTGEVLGASTNLPSTGASTVWAYIISLLIGLGSLSIFMGIALKKRLFKKITLFSMALLLVASVFAVPHAVQAADSDLTIRISEPKTPINQTFDLIFVALDMQQTRPLTVKCYKKGPSDGAYSQFGSDIAVIAGGNSGKCDITDSLLSQKGTYYFYTTVEADLGPVASQTVAVDYNSTDGPGTPTNYAKDHISSCQNKISFKTSDDGGKTVKVEVYRNENTSFGVDSSNRVSSIGIGSNTDGSYTDTVPDCNKTYYYVIRAFDIAGNGSGVIGDSVVTITNSSTTTTTTTAAAGGAIPVAGGNIPGEASVLGEETSATKEAKAQGEVLGQKAEVQKKSVGSNILSVLADKKMRPWYIAIALLAVGIIGYVIYKKRNQNETETPHL